MLRGDLQTTPLADLLQRLSGAKATGCVYLLPKGQPSDGIEATVSLREGEIYGVALPGTGDALGIRLVATSRLTPADLAEAKLAQETELASWMLADLLIHLGLADEQHVRDVTAEHALSDLTELFSWSQGSWRFRRRTRLGRNLPEPLPVDEALVAVGMRQEQWRRLLPTILGADAVVSLAADQTSAESEAAGDAVEIGAEAFVMLCSVDGTRTIAELAAASGFTLLDAGMLTAQLVAAGMVQVALDTPEAPLASDVIDDAPTAERHSLELAPLEPVPDFGGDEPLLPENIRYGFSANGPEWQPPSWYQSDRLADALARVSAALSDAMNEPTPAAVDVAEAAEPFSVEFVEPELSPVELIEHEPLDLLSELVNDNDAVDPEAEAFLDTVEEPYDEAFLESVEAVIAPETLEADQELAAHTEVGDAILEEQRAEAEAFLETVEEPYDEAFLEAVEAVIAPEELEAEPALVTQPELEPVAEAEPEPAAEEPAARTHGRTANAAQASRMLSQLVGDESSQSAAEPEPEEPAGEPAGEQHPVPVGYAPTPRRQTGPADTAALMRELSSLGAEDGGGGGGGSNRPVAPRPAPSATPGQGVAQRKRKGLFGRN